MQGLVWIEPGKVDERLASLDLTREILMAVVTACVSARSDCTDNDPPIAPGIMTWIRGTRRFREILRPLGWEKDDTANFATIVNHDRRIRIAVLNSDDGAGDIEKLPRARSRKGVNAERVADRNRQLAFPGWDEIAVPNRAGNDSDYATWYLVVYIEGDRVAAELSLPVSFSSGNFTSWQERIFLLLPGGWPIPGVDEDDLGPDLPVEVLRK